MANIFTKGITKIFGSKSDKDIKAVMPYVNKTNEIFAGLANVTNDELRGKTHELRAKINSGLKYIDDEISSLNQQVEEDKSLDIHAKDDIFKRCKLHF